MNMTPKIMLSALLVLGPAVVLAQATQPTRNDKSARPAAPEWSESDTNRDGYLTKDELIPFPGVLKNFERIDTDGDGRISEEEYRAWRDKK